MNLYRKLRVFLLVLLSGGTLFVTPSCGDLTIYSIKTGLLSFVSGSVTTTLSTGTLGDLLSNLPSNSTFPSSTNTSTTGNTGLGT